MTTIALLNESTVVTDDQLALYAAACHHQCRYHLQPHWGRGGNVVSVPKGGVAPSGAWLFHIRDTSDQPGALGYHDIHGNPELYAFAKTDQADGALLSVTISHEILEAVMDPDCQRGEQRETNGYWYGLELGDPVEADQDGYDVTPHGYTDRVTVSNFILEDWFGNPSGAARYDYRGLLTAPWQVRPGGYCSVWNGSSWGQYQQRDGDLVQVPLEPGDPRFRTHVRAERADRAAGIITKTDSDSGVSADEAA